MPWMSWLKVLLTLNMLRWDVRRKKKKKNFRGLINHHHDQTRSRHGRSSTLNLKVRLWLQTPAISSYSAASSSWRSWGWNSFGRTCCLMIISRKNGKGNNIPAMGIHVTPKHTRRYTNWNRVNMKIYLKGTDSTNEAWTPSNTLLKTVPK